MNETINLVGSTLTISTLKNANAFVDFENSILCDFTLNYDKHPLIGEQFQNFCQDIFNSIPITGRSCYKPNHKKKALEMLISNLVNATYLNKTLAVSLNNNDFGEDISCKSFKFAYKGLLDSSLIEIQNGFHSKGLKEGRRTRIWMSYNLRCLIKASGLDTSVLAYQADNTPVEWYPTYEPLIELRDSNGQNLELPDNVDTEHMTEFLEQYNAECSRHTITLPEYGFNYETDSLYRFTETGCTIIHDVQNDYHLMNYLDTVRCSAYGYELSASLQVYEYPSNSTFHLESNCVGRFSGLPDGRPPDAPFSAAGPFSTLHYSQLHITKNDSDKELILGKNLMGELHRVFNREMERGGRFYGAGYQNIKSKLRQHLLLDGNRTVELDYSALHPRMLYHESGMDYKADPYDTISEYLQKEHPKLRDILKISLNTMINAPDRKKCKMGIVKNLNEEGLYSVLPSMELSIDDILNAMEVVHRPITDRFNTGAGAFLMKKDSDIAEDIMSHFLHKGILCLCVHDSFIINEQYEHELKKVMQDAYFQRIGFECCLKKDQKNIGLNRHNWSQAPCV